MVTTIITIYTFSGGHICWSPYTVVTRLLAIAGPVVPLPPVTCAFGLCYGAQFGENLIA